MTRKERILRNIRIAVFGYSAQEQWESQARAMSGWTSALAGKKPKSWYTKHAEEYERTGNVQELERMLRHVKEAE